jgi:DNA-binding MarR family transcriptional regulator
VAPDTSLERIIRIAAFRSNLRTFLRQSEVVSRKWGLTPQRYLLLLAIKGAPDGSQRLSVSALAERLQLERHTVT